MDTILDTVRSFAEKAHQGQTSKHSAEPYIEHPIRVSEIVRHYNVRLPVVAAALLHDVVEKTKVSSTALSVFLHNIMEPDEAAETLRLVVQLTDVYTQSNYPQWDEKERNEKEHERLAKISPEAQTIKYADILDNTRQLTSNDQEAAPESLSEYLDVLLKAEKGNTALHIKALEAVRYGLYAIKVNE